MNKYFCEVFIMKKLGSPGDLLVMTLGTAIIAGAVFFFLIPADIPLGSVTGLALVLNRITSIRISLLTFILNVVLLIIGFLTIGREFGAKTVYTSILPPTIMAGLEKALPNNTSIMGDPILDVVCFLFVCAIGQTMLFNANASSGGLDIVGKILNKYLRMELGPAVALAGMCVSLLTLFCYDLRTVILSLLGTYLSGIVLDHFIFSMGGKKKVCILSKKEEEIKRFILDDLNRGATLYDVIGAYDGVKRREILTIVDKNEYRALLSYINRTDPSAFVTVYPVNEVVDNARRIPKPKKKA